MKTLLCGAAALALLTLPAAAQDNVRSDQTIQPNELAQQQMHALVRLEIIPGATHLFEEPGTLERVSRVASSWFSEHLHAT